MNKKLKKLLDKNGFLIATHRGSYAANVIDNTILSADLALRFGTDIVEIDAIKSTDNILYAFHSGEEKKRFATEFNISELSSKEIDNLEYYNVLNELSGRKVDKLEDILLSVKGKGMVNVDRAWDIFDYVLPLVRKLKMEDEIIIKSPVRADILELLSKNKDIMYMPIIRKKDELEQVLQQNINIVAVEILFFTEEDELISKEFIEYLKSKNILVWINAIKLGKDEKFNFNAGYSDDLSLEKDNTGWAWLVAHGADVIQTDFPMLLKEFRDKLIK